MKDIKSIIRLNCDEELDIKYFAKDDSITDTTIDYSELLEYINEIEDENEKLHSIIKEVREYIEEHIAMFKNGDMLVDMNIDELLEILDKENI